MTTKIDAIIYNEGDTTYITLVDVLGETYEITYQLLAELEDAIADIVQDTHPLRDDADVTEWSYEYAQRRAAGADARAHVVERSDDNA